MYVNPAAIMRHQGFPAGSEPIRTRPDRITEDGEPVRYSRPGRNTARWRAIRDSAGIR
jgi:hypothetical protein